MPALPGPLLGPSATLRRLLTLHIAPVLVVWTSLLWLRLALSSLRCHLRLERRRCSPLVCLFTNCHGGYHSDLRRAWHSLELTVVSGAPKIKWGRLRRLTVYFDDPVNYPAEFCRASLGYVVASGCPDPQQTAATWRSHPLVGLHGLQVAVLPGGDCLATDLPHCGPLSYLICLVRALHCFRHQTRAMGLHSKVPGLLELHTPVERQLSFLLPLEAREELLPF